MSKLRWCYKPKHKLHMADYKKVIYCRDSFNDDKPFKCLICGQRYTKEEMELHG